MENREYVMSLYEIYKNLLTDREKEYFENYYYEDYSLQEIADNYNVSKSYVGKLLNTIYDKLVKYEEALFLYKRINGIRAIISKCDNDLKSKIEIYL